MAARSLDRSVGGSPNALVTAIPRIPDAALRNNFDGKGGRVGRHRDEMERRATAANTRDSRTD